MTADENLPVAENFYQDFSPRKPSKPENQYFFPKKSPPSSKKSLGSQFIDSLNEPYFLGASQSTSPTHAVPSAWSKTDEKNFFEYSPTYTSSDFCEETNIYGPFSSFE